ncbi:hypothetical protein Mpt1_c14300 [Candidatus Methanoplasma termitum]|uniref:Carboxypeptidase regulatory-like domain-containing protein n=1 Tax=Candidatus Methanoplasma termitum TaxID=1577791 RepID=A0A0A7LIF1_9ARCH|nr:carboxypeptidase-like regulatory domain-containing protein [Candidatus Methanoplasma termitum]AIZ57286.1 hypothetical protein Mpt1_c14300 [Candidatus Methanoplasma termitum]MCL2334065.1 carboxypeptidase-like regulatory domain-containing protein [Candidatus Methanoplasma sp.]
MRYKLLLVLVAVSVLVPLTSFVSDGADNVNASNYYIEGYLADTLGRPLDNVTIVVTDASSTQYPGTYDSETGFFSVGVAVNTGLSISFTAYGYTAISCMSCPKQQNGSFILNLTKDNYNSANHTYTITGYISEGLYVIMSATDGWVGGRVSYVNGPVKDATVTLTPTSGGSDITVSTNDNGDYLTSCPTGTYNVSAGRQGFITSGNYTITVKNNNTEQVPLVQNIVLDKADSTTHTGVDVAHLLMLIGVIVGILMAVAAWLLSRRVNEPNRLEIIDDNEDNEELRGL